MNTEARIPPQALEIEQKVLGSLLLEDQAADEVFARLSPANLYKPGNRLIFEAMQTLYNQGKPIDVLTVEEHLKNHSQLDSAGGAGYLSDLTTSGSQIESIEYYCQIIREKSIRRNLILNCTEIIKQSYDTTTDTYDVVDMAQESVFRVTEEITGTMKVLSDTLQTVFEKVEHIQKSGKPIGLQTGLDIDDILRGFQNSKLYVIAARPSMGKTALVITMMRRFAKGNQAAGILSLETSDEAIGIRLISQVSDIPAEKITSGQMSPDEIERFEAACQELDGLGIYIDDQPALTAQQVRSKCRLMAKKGVEIIFIDFLQLILSGGRSRHEEIGNITKILKQTSKELDKPIVVLSQLSRKVEERNDKRPRLADLRESGSIEEDADCVIFLYRPEYYGIETHKGESTHGLAEIIIAKNKDGRTGTKTHQFLADSMRFENREYRQPDPVKPHYVPNSDYDHDSPF
jgi:replicative DNA helicase